jgi:acyl-CoA synthetase (AMP-forming)/AMP-acid ligase II
MSSGGTTVLSRLAASLERSPEAAAVHLHAPGREVLALSHQGLHATARRAARGLAALGLSRGDVLLLALPTHRELLGLYLASLCAGVIPLILPEPRSAQAGEIYAEQVQRLAAQTGARHLCVPPEARDHLAAALRGIAVAGGDLLDHGEAPLELSAAPEDVAHLQATSGSTGSPKVAVVRHRNVAANVRAIGEAIGEREGDRVVSWLPLYHDMGLICISCALFWQRPLVLTDSTSFVRHPINHWLGLISAFGGTISPAPASAYQVCARLAARRRFAGLDLSSWRVGFCGAEPVHPRTLADFQEAFAPYGLSPTTLLPVYGLAEATLAVTIPRQGSRPRLDTVDARLLEEEHRAVPLPPGGPRALTLTGLGPPLAGHSLRVTGAGGEPLGERQVGEVEVQGPSVLDGYWGDAGQALAGGPLRTGDLGYLADGELFITGRKKDIVIARGRNLLPSQLEALAGEVLASGIQNGVAAVGIMNDEIATEELHLIVESRVVPPADQDLLEERLRNALAEGFEVTGIYIHWVRKGSIPKTTSGKIQRSRCRDLVHESRQMAQSS